MFSLKKYKFLIVAVLIIVSVFSYYLLSNQGIYGNDEDSIVQVIRSIDGYGEGLIEILDIKDLENDRYVSFLDNNHPAYIRFTKNSNENYEWRFIKRGNPKFSTFLEPTKNNDRYEGAVFWVVTNNENDIAKMELNVNGEIVEQNFDVNKNSVTWIALPESDGSYAFDYKYFDKDGNVIEQ